MCVTSERNALWSVGADIRSRLSDSVHSHVDVRQLREALKQDSDYDHSSAVEPDISHVYQRSITA